MRWLLVALLAQQATIRTTVPLVVAPTTITDRAGQPVDGLTERDLVLYDNSVARRIHLEETRLPVSLVVAVQARTPEVLDKVRRIGGIVEPLVTGEGGEAAVLSFSRGVRLEEDFTGNHWRIRRALREIEPQGDGGCSLDAVNAAVRMLAKREGSRRRVVILVAESRDRGSQASLEDTVTLAQNANVTVYTVTYSKFLTPFTSRPAPDHPQAPAAGGMNLLAIFPELRALGKANIAAAFATYTGGRACSFVRLKALEEAVAGIGRELHTQYLLSFTPRDLARGEYRRIRVEVIGRPELNVRTRAGYWAP